MQCPRRPVFLTLAFLLSPTAVALELPETGIRYEIEVQLDPATRRLEGRETIHWTNPAVSPIDRVPMHLYLNAFSHEDTTWMRAVLGRRFGIDSLFELYDDPWGWIEPSTIRSRGTDLAWRAIAPDDGNPNDRSLIEITLGEPLMPGETLVLELEFEARLPIPIARTGGHEDFFLVSHWFPKISVFETAGVRGAPADRWAAHQFHGMTEFYADYADFDVRIGVPAGWAVVATGSGGPEGEAGEAGTVWHRYRQRAVHDFAFSTGERMVDVVSTHRPAGGGGPVELHIFVPRGTEHQAARWRRAVEGSLDVLGSRVGPYPYETITAVMPPWRGVRTMGMEYPTLFTGAMGDPLWDVGLLSRLRLNEGTIAHEFAHQYFYGIVGTNEFEEAFLDEGFTEFWGSEIMIGTFGEEAAGGEVLGRRLGMKEYERSRLGRTRVLPPVWSEPSFLALGLDIGVQFYHRPAATLRTAAGLFGRDTIDELFALYYERWAFGHPRFEDFLDAARETGGAELAAFLLEAFTQTLQPDYRVSRFRTELWSAPDGRLVTAEGIVEPDTDREDELALAGLEPAALETDGVLWMEVVDPGWTREGLQQPGSVERRELLPEAGEPDEDWEAEEDQFHLSRVRLEGGGWHHLPVEVRFRFADGAVVLDRWDGRAAYRVYRFLRPAPLSEVRIDPEDLIAVDPNPVNNARMREADRGLVNDWSLWLGGLFQLLLESAAQCL